MGKTKQFSPKYQIWIDARKRFKLSHAHIQMAREIGLNPKKLGKLANHKQELWKEPLPDYITTLYHKHFGRDRPEIIRSIEQMLKDKKRKSAERKELKGQKAKQIQVELKAEIPF